MSTSMPTRRASATLVGAAALAVASAIIYSKTHQSNKDSPKTTRDSAPRDFEGIDIGLQPYYASLLARLPGPKSLFKYFMLCLQTPRKPHNLEQMTHELERVAELLRLDFSVDEIGNVCLRKPASPGYESAKSIAIQCHMDIVCTAKDGVRHNFETDPIKGWIDGDWLKADGTTLGSDDGIGISAGLALLEDPNLIHGPLELLVTVNEETTMDGALQIAPSPFLQSEILINVDSEEEHRVCIGCAGGFEKYFYVPMEALNDASGLSVLDLRLLGLRGGHTGVEIHVGLANAIVLLARLLTEVSRVCEGRMSLVHANGGNASNAIPSSAAAQICVPSDSMDAVKSALTAYMSDVLVVEFDGIESAMELSMDDEQKDPAGTPFSFKSTSNLIDFMLNLPHGPVRYHPKVEGLVQTSISFSMLHCPPNANEAKLDLFARSMSQQEMTDLNARLNGLGRITNCRASPEEDPFPGWLPNVDSAILEVTKQVHADLFGKEPDVYAIHAGLECGIIMSKYPYLDCVSIGPTIEHAHSPDEKLKISSVPEFYDWLRAVVTRSAIETSS